VLADLAVRGEEGRACACVERAPGDGEVDGGIRTADVDPVADPGEPVPVHEQLTHVQVTVANGRVAGRWQLAGGCDERRGVDAVRLEARQAPLPVPPAPTG